MPKTSLLLLLITVLSSITSAQFSAFSSDARTQGLTVVPTTAREAGMGGAGSAVDPGYSMHLGNPARMAFQQKTLFLATLAGDLTWLRDDQNQNRMTDFSVPLLAGSFPTKHFGTFGFFYREAFHRNYSVKVLSPSEGSRKPTQEFISEGSLSTAGLMYGIAPVPFLAIGINWQVAFGHDRFIKTADYTSLNGVPTEIENLPGDTLELRKLGNYAGFSGMVKLPWARISGAYEAKADLDETRYRTIPGYLQRESDSKNSLPHRFILGGALPLGTRNTLALDGLFESWSQLDDGLDDAFRIVLGWERTGNQGYFESFWKKLDFRAGAGVLRGPYNMAPSPFLAIGVGMPLGQRGARFDFALEGGHREAGGDTFLAEEYLKAVASFTGVGVWGQPARRRR